MKYLQFAITILLVIHVTLGLGVCSDPNGVDAEMYQWTEDSGTINYSDNPMSVPREYGNKVKKRDSITGEARPNQVRNEESVNKRQTNPDRQLYGGHDESWWRYQFSNLRSQIKIIKETAPEKEARLKELHYKKVVSNSTGMSPVAFGNPRKSREAYKELYQEINADKEKLMELEKKLGKLEDEASREWVPLEWRESK
jgi:Domain of unknown function (DUF4124)